MSTNLYEETIDEGHRKTVKDTKLQRMTTVNNEELTNDGNEVVKQHGEEGLPYTKNEHFINPPMFCFCSDLPSVMVKLRKECFKSNKFMFTYGCAPHAIHNLCMDLCK
jgi:hypothetical protein